MKPTFLILILLSCITCSCQPITINGLVINEDGNPVPNATVTIKPSNQSFITNTNGQFTIHYSPLTTHDSLIVSATGYDHVILSLSKDPFTIHHSPFTIERPFTVTLKRKITELDEVIMQAYGTTTQRFNTGNIARVSAKDIEKQPVANPLLTLQGRVPGLLISTTSGVPGAAVKIELRGRNSISQGSDPLFVIDGVPWAAGNSIINQVTSAANVPGSIAEGGLSPFAAIDPSSIESIEVLKDADATAIYGSRGANGVILITTKKGRAGKTKLSADIYYGISTITRSVEMMNTKQYLHMRRTAFANDAVILTLANAPDLMAWDTTRHTDFRKQLTGGTAQLYNAQLSLSGGSSNTQFAISGAYRRETTVFPGSMCDGRASFHASLSHSSPGKKFTMLFTAQYVADDNNINVRDLTTYLKLPPNTPAFFDELGTLQWQQGGAAFDNPMSYLLKTYRAQTNNLLSSLRLSYKLLDDLVLSANFGYNKLTVDETSLNPRLSQNPANNPSGSSQFGHAYKTTWITEPQLEYNRRIAKGKLNILIGGTWQQLINSSSYLNGTGYSSDVLLHSLSGAAAVTASNAYSQYKYVAFFGRLTYRWLDKYIINLSGRRDGSSRFGPGNQFANFAAAGAAWIFSNESFVNRHCSFISYGKLRAGYGSTGNDQIGDYKFLDSWSATPNPYQGISGLSPTRLFNEDYQWEINRKLEVALELGFLKDRLLFTVAWFRNRSGNQLIAYKLPSMTGFSSIAAMNFPAVVQNTGWEYSLVFKSIEKKNFTWSTSFNVTIPRNKLVAFPGIETSSYSTLTVGQPLSVRRGYHFLGVDPATGVFAFEDVNNDGLFKSSDDYRVLKSREPKYYGGWSNSFSYHAFQLDVFIEYRKQTGSSYMASIFSGTYTPGLAYNQPIALLDYWQKPGDVVAMQKYTVTTNSAAAKAVSLFNNSDAAYTDASFIRLKNLSLSYNPPAALLKKCGLQSASLYMHAQNLFVVTKYKGADPEVQNLYVLPPLKTIVFGIRLTF